MTLRNTSISTPSGCVAFSARLWRVMTSLARLKVVVDVRPPKDFCLKEAAVWYVASIQGVAPLRKHNHIVCNVYINLLDLFPTREGTAGARFVRL